jgi:hypothetical protein
MTGLLSVFSWDFFFSSPIATLGGRPGSSVFYWGNGSGIASFSTIGLLAILDTFLCTIGTLLLGAGPGILLGLITS